MIINTNGIIEILDLEGSSEINPIQSSHNSNWEVEARKDDRTCIGSPDWLVGGSEETEADRPHLRSFMPIYLSKHKTKGLFLLSTLGKILLIQQTVGI